MIELFTKANLTIAVLGVVALLVIFSAIRMHRDPHNDFNLLDLLMENGHVSKAAVVMMGAFSLTTWMMVHLTLIGKMAEGYFGLYAAAWIAPVVVKLITQGPTSHGERVERDPVAAAASAPAAPNLPAVPAIPALPKV